MFKLYLQLINYLVPAFLSHHVWTLPLGTAEYPLLCEIYVSMVPTIRLSVHLCKGIFSVSMASLFASLPLPISTYLQQSRILSLALPALTFPGSPFTSVLIGQFWSFPNQHSLPQFPPWNLQTPIACVPLPVRELPMPQTTPTTERPIPLDHWGLKPFTHLLFVLLCPIQPPVPESYWLVNNLSLHVCSQSPNIGSHHFKLEWSS